MAREATERYISGVASGLAWANAELRSMNRQPLYCAPENLPMNFENYRDLIDGYITKLAKTVPQEKLDKFFAGGALLRALIKAFPCEGRK
jgi:hypothetical protein